MIYAMAYCEGVFVALGLSGVIPAGHFVITDGLSHAFNYAALGWIILMAFLYIIGAVVYAARVPERIWPGRFDIWVSHLHCKHKASSRRQNVDWVLLIMW